MTEENKSIFLRPFTVFGWMILFTVNLILGATVTYWMMLGCSFGLLFLTKAKKAIKIGIIYLFMWGAVQGIHASGSVNHWLGAIYTMMLILLKLSPIWILAEVMTEYNTSEIINSLRKIRVPNSICISVALFFRFLPEYIGFLREIDEGVKVRGLKFRCAHPMESFELYVVPMIYKAFETGEMLTCSLITKGVEYSGKKSSYRDLSFTWKDGAALFLGILFLVVTMWSKYQ